MPYLYKKLEGEEARKHAVEAPPFGPGFPPDVAAKAERLEVWCSEFKDPGPDYSEIRLFDGKEEPLGIRRLAGY